MGRNMISGNLGSGHYVSEKDHFRGQGCQSEASTLTRRWKREMIKRESNGLVGGGMMGRCVEKITAIFVTGYLGEPNLPK